MTAPRQQWYAPALGLVVGVLADQLFGDPRRGHPVAAFGSLAARMERGVWRDSRPAGVGYLVACAAPVTLAGMLADRRAGRWRAVLEAATTWTVVGGTSLAGEAAAVHAHLERGDLGAARQQLTHLVGRDTSQLGETEICRAVLESVAENASDAVVAPLLFGALGGTGGLIAYRAINTLDAMVGHKSARYRRFGWAAARTDDLANLLPARLSAAVAASCAAVVDGSPSEAWRAARRWAGEHPSPNAGWVEAAFAGALGVQLGGRNVYAGVPERRPVLGDGRSPGRGDIPRAVRLLTATTAVSTAICAGVATAVRRGGR